MELTLCFVFCLCKPLANLVTWSSGTLKVRACHVQERIEHLGEGVPELLILPIYSQLPSDLQARPFRLRTT